MSRPMILMREERLKSLYSKFKMGVPVLAIIRQNTLDNIITPPTLTKLLRHYEAYANTDSKEVKDIVHKSLFPNWLTDVDTIVMSTPPKDWYYQGKMPLGKWQKRDIA